MFSREQIVASTLVFFTTLFPKLAQAFPELVRHGYPNCTACHVSPTGGGSLSEYGRELSRELLSTWGKDGEQKYFYAIKTPEKIAPGGDFRTLYLYRDNPSYREGKWIPMQYDLEAYVGVFSNKLWFGGVVGIEKPDQSKAEYKVGSRRHFVNFLPTDQISLRAGRFQMAYGINIPDHATSIKRDLGWDQGNETYNLEAAWIGESWNHYITANFGRPDDLSKAAEKGFALSSSYAFKERFKIGWSYFRGEKDTQSRSVTGPFAILGFTHKLFLLSEFDYQWLQAKPATTPEQKGFVTYNKLGYEAYKGIIPFITHEISYQNVEDVSSRADVFGLGLQWFPRPHLETSLTWQKRRTNAFNRQYVDMAYLLLHFYP